MWKLAVDEKFIVFFLNGWRSWGKQLQRQSGVLLLLLLLFLSLYCFYLRLLWIIGHLKAK